MNLKDKKGQFDAPVLIPVKIPTIGLPLYKQLRNALSSRKWYLGENFYFIDSKNNICMIPAGRYYELGWKNKPYQFIFDGTSWPRPVRMLIGKMGIGLTAGITHDFSTRYRCFLNGNGKVIRVFNTLKENDEEFRLIDARVNGIKWWSNIKWAMVKLGSWKPWNKYQKLPENQRNALKLL